MGYSTYFTGGITFNKPLTLKLHKTINDFAKERHEGICFPGYWCQWVIDSDYNGEEALVWDGGEKFYNYVDWLKYLIETFFEPNGYVLNGTIEYQGEESDDFGIIKVQDNVITQEFGIHEIDLSEIDTQILIKEIERRGYYVE